MKYLSLLYRDSLQHAKMEQFENEEEEQCLDLLCNYPLWYTLPPSPSNIQIANTIVQLSPIITQSPIQSALIVHPLPISVYFPIEICANSRLHLTSQEVKTILNSRFRQFLGSKEWFLCYLIWLCFSLLRLCQYRRGYKLPSRLHSRIVMHWNRRSYQTTRSDVL